MPPERDVNLFILRVGGRGVGDMAAQGLFPGSACVCLSVCLFVRSGVGGMAGCEFRGKDRTKRFRRVRSTFSSKEVGSDSLILRQEATLLYWGAKASRLGTCPPGSQFLRVY